MTVQVEHGRFQTPSSTGDKTVTGLSFEPDLIEFHITSTNTSFNTEGSTGGAPFGFGHGFADVRDTANIVERSVSEGSGSSSTNGFFQEVLSSASINALITSNDGAILNGTVTGSVTETQSDGFTVNFSSAYNQQWIEFTAYNLTGGESAEVGHFNRPTSTGTFSVTTGFEPTFVNMKGVTYVDSMDTRSSSTDHSGSGGIMHGLLSNVGGTTKERSACVSMSHNNINTHMYVMSDVETDYMIWDDNSGSVAGRVTAAFDSWNTDGFTLNYTEVNPNNGSSHPIIYMAVDSGALDIDIGHFSTPTSTGDKTITTDIGSVKSISTIINNSIDQLNSEVVVGSNSSSGHYGWCHGVSSLHSTQMGMGWSSHSNSVNAHAWGSSDGDMTYLLYTDTDGTILGRDVGSTTSVSNGDVTVNWSEVVTSSTGNVRVDQAYGLYYAVSEDLNSVSGNVTFDSDGTAVSGADVLVHHSSGSVYSASTDANGDYTVEVPSGTVHVLVQYEDGSTKYHDESKPFVDV